MSEHNLTAPETASIRRRLKPEEEEEILLATATTATSSVAVVESPKRRKVESSSDSESESTKYNRCSSISTSPRKPLLEVEKNDSSTTDTRLRRFCAGTVLHAPASTICSEEESSSGFVKQISDPLDDRLKSENSSHIDASVVVSRSISISTSASLISDLKGRFQSLFERFADFNRFHKVYLVRQQRSEFPFTYTFSLRVCECYSPESEVCADLPVNEMESSKSTENTQSRTVVSQIPTAAEIEEFFLAAEKVEAQRFKDKYNFDIVNDVPVKGRFEWSRVKH